MTRLYVAAGVLVGVALGLGWTSNVQKVPAGWTEGKDPVSGQVYYFNPSAQDTSVYCGVWAQKGECERKMPFMMRSCPQSCQKVKAQGGIPEPPPPPPPPLSAMTGSGQSATWHQAKRLEPKDRNVHCGDWSLKGECSRNPVFMLQTCPKSCMEVSPNPPPPPAVPLPPPPPPWAPLEQSLGPVQMTEGAEAEKPRVPRTPEVALPFACFVLVVLLMQGYCRARRDLAWAGGVKDATIKDSWKVTLLHENKVERTAQKETHELEFDEPSQDDEVLEEEESDEVDREIEICKMEDEEVAMHEEMLASLHQFHDDEGEEDEPATAHNEEVKSTVASLAAVVPEESAVDSADHARDAVPGDGAEPKSKLTTCVDDSQEAAPSRPKDSAPSLRLPGVPSREAKKRECDASDWRAASREEFEKRAGGRTPLGGRVGSRTSQRKSSIEVQAGNRTPSTPLPPPSPFAFRRGPSSPGSRPEELRRSTMSSLNKLCPENQEKILQRLVALEIDSADDLKTVISVLFQKALCDPHYCETFADVVFELSSRYPEFSSDSLDDQPTTFMSLLEASCQHELGVVLKGVEATSPNNIEQSDDVDRRRSMDSAYMKFVGHLFIRRLISPGIVGKILHQLLAPDAASAACVECACTLLHAIGHTLDAAPRGKEQINLVFLRLRDLKASGGPPHQPWSSKLPQFKIQDLLDLRANGWKMKKFAESAKTKKNLLWADDSPYELVVAGSLPECMTPSSKEIYKCRPRQDTS